MDLSGNEMALARKEAYSIESLPEGSGQLTTIGKRQQGSRIYIYYRDEYGRYWFRNLMKTNQGILPEYDSIFGHKEPYREKKK